MHIDVHQTWGYKDPKTGQFTGMSGQLQRKEADIAGLNQEICIFDQFTDDIYLYIKPGTVIFMTIDRLPILDYLSMEFPTRVVFILRSPPISYVSNIYYLPFSGVTWICSISLVVLCTIVVAMILHLKPDEKLQHMKASDYFLFAIASTCQMGPEILTKVLSARISIVSIFQKKSKLLRNYTFWLHCQKLDEIASKVIYSSITTAILCSMYFRFSTLLL